MSGAGNGSGAAAKRAVEQDMNGGGLYKRNKVANARVVSFRPLIPPSLLQEELPISAAASEVVISAREAVSNVLNRRDPRVVVVVGPCSIHSHDSAIDYAQRLKKLADKPEIKENLIIIMRVYFEKPRTTIGWKGLINDPFLDGTFEINKGLRLARNILLEINELGLPCGCEFLDSISPQYTSDLVSWGAIGARTTESQIHRELASGLSCPIGFKNGTSGSVQLAVDAMQSAMNPHNFLGVNDQGLAAIVKTTGNPDVHVILRGGTAGPNYSAEDVESTMTLLRSKIDPQDLTGLFVDCSHGNSSKKYQNQVKVVDDIAQQIAANTENSPFISGLMIESNIVAGNQKLDVGRTDPKSLVYGKSVTDECVDLDTTEKMLDVLAAAVAKKKTQ